MFEYHCESQLSCEATVHQVTVCTVSELLAALLSLSLLLISGMKARLSRLYHLVHLSSEQLTSARLIWAPAWRGGRGVEGEDGATWWDVKKQT